MPPLNENEGYSHIPQGTNGGGLGGPRIVCYHQTHYHNGQYVSILPLIRNGTGVTHVIIAAFHINMPAGNITLNDDPYVDPKYNILWAEVKELQRAGVKVLGMLGGACAGSYPALDGDIESFLRQYAFLKETIAWTGLDGMDLDVEEEMSLPGIIRLIDYLKTDFGKEFLITLAPVAPGMRNARHLSGFDYAQLEKAMGHKIDWYNVQFYCGWGSLEDLEHCLLVLTCGWDPEKIVIGMVTNPANGRGWVPDHFLREVLSDLLSMFPNIGGVMGWEYFNSVTLTSPAPGADPSSWAKLMTDIFQTNVVRPVIQEGSQSILKEEETTLLPHDKVADGAA